VPESGGPGLKNQNAKKPKTKKPKTKKPNKGPMFWLSIWAAEFAPKDKNPNQNPPLRI